MANRRGRLARTVALIAVGAASFLALPSPSPAGATSSTSWGFVCSSDYGWVRANWPTIKTNSTQPRSVYFRALLDRWTRSGWRYVGNSGWYVGVSNRYGRFQLDSSLGTLPYPFVGELGHLFGYTSGHGTYAGPQLGPWWGNLPNAYYRTREQYSVGRTNWHSNRTYVNGTNSQYCWA